MYHVLLNCKAAKLSNTVCPGLSRVSLTVLFSPIFTIPRYLPLTQSTGRINRRGNCSGWEKVGVSGLDCG